MEDHGYNLRQRPFPVLISDQSSVPISTTATADSFATIAPDRPTVQLPIHVMYFKHSVHFQIKLFIVVIKLPHTIIFGLFLHIYFLISKKNIDRTLFRRGNVLKLSSYKPNNKIKSSNL